MKNLIIILILLVAVGCGKSLTEEEKGVVGRYELVSKIHKNYPDLKIPKGPVILPWDGGHRVHFQVYVFFENRTVVLWDCSSQISQPSIWNNMTIEDRLGAIKSVGKKRWERKWKLVGKEVHFEVNEVKRPTMAGTSVFKIEPNGDLNRIAHISKGKRYGMQGFRLKKIKSPEEKLAGTYAMDEEGVILLVLRENGKVELYSLGVLKGNKTWELVGKEVHVPSSEIIKVYKIEPNGDLTWIASIEGGNRTDHPKEDQITFKKIK